jgi:hypothetical protein
MKLIYGSPDLAAVTHLKDLLEAAGIVGVVKNGEVSPMYGGALNEATPELWIEDDSRLAEALEIKEGYLGPQIVQGSAWTCPKCGEKSEPQFTSCWNCGTAKP